MTSTRAWTGAASAAVGLLGIGGLVALSLARRPSGEVLAIRVEAESGAPVFPATAGRPLRFVVGSMISPAATFADYRTLLDRVGARLGRPIELLQQRTYSESNELLRTGGADAGLICTGAYAVAAVAFAPALIATPVASGMPRYRSDLIVPSGASTRSLDDLRGAAFAYVDPLSLSGRGWMIATLSDRGLVDTRYFGRIVYSGSHDRSVELVAHGDVDGAIVDSLVLGRLIRAAPELGDRVRIIDSSPWFPAPPVVAAPHVGPEEREGLRRAFLELGQDPVGRDALARIGLDGFAAPDSAAYAGLAAIMRLAVEAGAPVRYACFYRRRACAGRLPWARPCSACLSVSPSPS